MLIGGIKFVLDKVASSVEAELNNDERLREELLAAQMRLELGEITQEDFDALEAEILVRLREITERKRGTTSATIPSDAKVTGVDISFGGDDE
jgi:hypothetical protein